MNTRSPKFKIRLGLFVGIGLVLFLLAIFIIGSQKNLFDPVYTLKSRFNNVSGLQVGNSVRFSGISVGTVDKIHIVNDTVVQVSMVIRKEVQKFIKTDSETTIGSEGLIGDRLINISNGSATAKSAADGSVLASAEPIETDAIMASLQVTADNAAVATEEIAEILFKINNGEGTLGRLINDTEIAENIDQTIVNLKKSSKGLEQNMEAAKHNFLLRGYFKKKEREAERKKKEAEAKAKKLADEKAKQDKAKDNK